MKAEKKLTISIIIVSFNVREFLEQALLSLEKSLKSISHEIFVVDNASSDSTVAFIKNKFPQVLLFENSENLGFAKANNQAIKKAQGEYICLINPDTIVQENTFDVLIDFLENHLQAGMVGCKILNPDGSLQLACRRSFPTPWVAFTKIIGLASLFPKSRLFGRYNLTFLDPDRVEQVEAISGSFMITRRTVIEKVGDLDQDFFMYGEDLDWCYRIRKNGYQIYYVPTTQIIHFKGESSKKSPFQQRRLFYEAMRLFVKKHFHKTSAVIPTWILILAIYLSATFSFISTLIQKMIWPLFDLLLLTISLALAIYARFNPEFPWRPFVLVYIVYSLVWLISLAGHAAYSSRKLSESKAISGVLVGLLINSTLTFFFNQYGFSRLVVLYSGAINLMVIPGWRFLLKLLVNHGFIGFPASIRRFLLHRRSIIVGNIKTSEKLVQRLHSHSDKSYHVVGIVLLEKEIHQQKVAQVPVLGVIDQLPAIIKREKAQEVIFSTDKLPYDKMLKAISSSLGTQINFKMVPSNLEVVVGKSSVEYIDDIPFVDIDYRLHKDITKVIKNNFEKILRIFKKEM